MGHTCRPQGENPEAQELQVVEKPTKLAAEAGMPLSHRATADVELGQDVLDTIDEIVPTGTNVNAGDIYFTNPALTDNRLRRL
jgi:hypothetical protein